MSITNNNLSQPRFITDAEQDYLIEQLYDTSAQQQYSNYNQEYENPYGGNPYGGNPYGGNPYGGNPDDGNPNDGNPNPSIYENPDVIKAQQELEELKQKKQLAELYYQIENEKMQYLAYIEEKRNEYMKAQQEAYLQKQTLKLNELKAQQDIFNEQSEVIGGLASSFSKAAMDSVGQLSSMRQSLSKKFNQSNS